MKRNLLENPAWEEKDLGTPLSLHPSNYSAAVAIPTWDLVKQYEQGNPSVHRALRAGYPRYRLPNQVQDLFAQYAEQLASPGKTLFAFPSLKVADEALKFVYKQSGILGEIKDTNDSGIYAVLVPDSAGAILKNFWTHTGNILSARQSEDLLSGKKSDPAHESKAVLKQRLADIHGNSPDAIHLFPTGMSALFEAYKLIAQPGKKVVQLGLPFIDTLRIEEKWGEHELLPFLTAEDLLRRLQLLLESQASNIAGVITEFPANPLLKSIPVEQVSALLKKYHIPFLIDDSVGLGNSALLPHVDLLVSSLTKFFSGHGDVMGGAIALSPDSAFFEIWKERLTKKEDLLYGADAHALEENSRDFQQRFQAINHTTQQLVESLLGHIPQVFYPSVTDRALYESMLQANGGYGGLFSLVLPGEENSQRFFDALRVSKGPGFGIGVTTAVPQKKITLFGERDFALQHGLDPNIIRVSVGQEEPDDLIDRFKYALKAI